MAVVLKPRFLMLAKTGRRLEHESLRALARELHDQEIGGVKYELGYESHELDGEIIEVDLIMQRRLLMPRWVHERKRPECERNEWQRFLKALRFHEKGHWDICGELARGCYQRVKGLKDKSVLERMLQEELVRMEQVHAAFDERCDHGRAQDCTFGTTVIDVMAP